MVRAIGGEADETMNGKKVLYQTSTTASPCYSLVEEMWQKEREVWKCGMDW